MKVNPCREFSTRLLPQYACCYMSGEAANQSSLPSNNYRSNIDMPTVEDPGGCRYPPPPAGLIRKQYIWIQHGCNHTVSKMALVEPSHNYTCYTMNVKMSAVRYTHNAWLHQNPHNLCDIYSEFTLMNFQAVVARKLPMTQCVKLMPRM